jgi:hypothetical protein
LKVVRLLVIFAALVLLAGCGGGKKRAKVRPPAALPTVTAESRTSTPPPSVALPTNARPIMVEQGLASWYGGPYHNRKAANGETYDMHAMTAAHRTLPLNSLVRVINPKTGQSVVVRITDRGPFIEGRILDLSRAAARAIETWRAGVAPVKIEVLSTPKPIASGGRWAVQIGAFTERGFTGARPALRQWRGAGRGQHHSPRHRRTDAVDCGKRWPRGLDRRPAGQGDERQRRVQCADGAI